MLGLAGLTAPRRYVELGTLRGTSFFAFAQAARHLELDTEAIAVSAWAVEPDKADTYRNAFEDFQFLARKYGELASFLRQGHEAAAKRFAEGSVDLLHVDGFCEYDGAKSALDLWLPKLSSRGVLLLHDINAHGGSFGVWRLWDEIKKSYPSFEFRHAEGLGVACIGEDAPPALLTLAKANKKDAAIATLFQEHFQRMGMLSAELFSRRFDMQRMEMRGGAEGAVTEELSWLRQEAASARAEAEDLRELLQRNLPRAAG